MKIILKETDENELNATKRNKRKLILRLFLLGIFLAIIVTGLVKFINYDHEFKRKTEELKQHIKDSLFVVESNNREMLKLNKAREDSIINDQLREFSILDSLESVRRAQYRSEDSMRVDSFMCGVIYAISKTNKILARQLDINNFIYYFTDVNSPTLSLHGFDGVSKETFTILDDIDAKLLDSFVSPDNRLLFILFKNKGKELTEVLKYDMYGMSVTEYESKDESGNICYDAATTEDGFYMKFGEIIKGELSPSYTLYFDRYGNFITRKQS